MICSIAIYGVTATKLWYYIAMICATADQSKHLQACKMMMLCVLSLGSNILDMSTHHSKMPCTFSLTRHLPGCAGKPHRSRSYDFLALSPLSL